MGFQKQVNRYPAPGIEGKAASTALLIPAVSPLDGFVAGSNGLIMGCFCWRDGADDRAVNNATTGTDKPLGFVFNSGKAVLFQNDKFESTMIIQPGYPCDVLVGGDLWAKTATAATIGQKVFAVIADGTIQTGAAGATIAGAVETDYYVASSALVGELIKISTYTKG